MKTNLKKFIAGASMTIIASAFSACSPGIVAISGPRHVIYTPAPVQTVAVAPVVPVYAPVQTVAVTPVVPVWAPPYAYVTEVHYYYFPDYMMYYDVFAQNYCYYNGYNWLHVAMLPSMPVFYGFNPYNSYIVVLNQSAYQPWIRNDFYAQQYPAGYYKTMYAPRTSLGSNTILRAYDENQSKPLFVDKRSNREVAVKYDVRNPRNSGNNNSINNNPFVSPSTGGIKSSIRQQDMTVRTDRTETTKAHPDRETGNSMQQHPELISPAHATTRNNDSREVNANGNVKSHSNGPRNEIRNNQSVNQGPASSPVIKNADPIKQPDRSVRANANGKNDSHDQKKEKQNRERLR